MPVTPGSRSHRIAIRRPTWLARMLLSLLYGIIRILTATVRFQWDDRSGRFTGDSSRPVIFCIWHNRLALCLPLYLKYVVRRQPGRRMAAIVSASRDGARLAWVLELFHVQPVRGSSSRRGAQALLELTSWAELGFDLAVTPDGPRGPCYHVQEGVVSLAALTGLPIVPVTYHLRWKIRLNSWDRFQVPLPFSRCTVTLGESLFVPRQADSSEREEYRRTLEGYLLSLTCDGRESRRNM